MISLLRRRFAPLFLSMLEYFDDFRNWICSASKLHLYLFTFFVGFFTILASPPISFFFSLVISFNIYLFISITREKERYKLFFVFLLGYFVAHFHWLVAPLTTDVQYYILIPFALTLLPIIMAVFIFLPYFALSYIFDFGFKKIAICSKMRIHNVEMFKIVTSWFIGEYIRANFVFGGFPWMLLGHFVNSNYLLQVLRLVNVDIFSVFILMLIISPFLYFTKHKKVFILINFTFIANFFYGAYILHYAKKSIRYNISIAGSQVNYPIHMEISSYHSTEKLVKNLKQVYYARFANMPTLVLLPESALDFDIKSQDNISMQIAQVIPNKESLLLTGSMLFNDTNGKLYNTIHGINYNGEIVGIYNKEKLVPFGEYLPFRKFLPSSFAPIANSIDFANDGRYNNIVFRYANLPTLLPIICYESIFSKMIKSRIDYVMSMDNKGKALQRPIIINLTNDIWMGKSIGSLQLFKMSRITAIISDSYLIRVSNTGISSIINNYGEILFKTRFNREDILYSEI